MNQDRIPSVIVGTCGVDEGAGLGVGDGDGDGVGVDGDSSAHTWISAAELIFRAGVANEGVPEARSAAGAVVAMSVLTMFFIAYRLIRNGYRETPSEVAVQVREQVSGCATAKVMASAWMEIHRRKHGYRLRN